MSAKADEVSRAYAVFGLRPGAPARLVRRRYKALARQWHPDRYSSDARNQAEAASRMREINAAYRCLADHLGPGRRPVISAASIEGSSVRSLSREELDSLVQAIGSDGPIDWLLDGLSRLGGALRRTFVAVVAMACVLRVALSVSAGGAAAVFRDSTLFLYLALLALLALRAWTVPRKSTEP